MQLAFPLAFPLGGSGLGGGLPWIVNLLPIPETLALKLLRPISFSIRDSETYVIPSSVRVVTGYASVFSFAQDLFENTLPATKRVPLLVSGGPDPSVSTTVSGVTIQKLSSTNERSVYTTSIIADPGFQSVLLTAVVHPETVTRFDLSPGNPVSNGVVLGLEHGPRNKAIYFWLQVNPSLQRVARVTSFIDPIATPTINSLSSLDWNAFNRYTIVWNEVEGFLDIFTNTSSGNDRIYRTTISSIPNMPVDYFARTGSQNKITAVYGITGSSGDSVSWSNIAITTNVGYPILGSIRPGDYVTSIQGAEFEKISGEKDPRDLDIASWITTIVDQNNLDALATTSVSDGIFIITKPTPGKIYALYKEEPGFLSSGSEGIMIETNISVDSTQQDAAATGVGFTIFDGQSVFQLQLFNDFATKTIGLLKKDGNDADISEYFIPSTAIDWSTETFRLVIDPRRNSIRLHAGDLTNSLLDIPFDRLTLPTASDKGFTGLTPFIIFGHTIPVNASGSFRLKSLNICHLYQAWDSEDLATPNGVGTSPLFIETTTGTPVSGLTADNDFSINASTGDLDKFHRTAFLGAQRGGVIEARVKIVSWRPLSRSGVYLLLDDGLHTYALTFVDSSMGKFVALSQRANLGGFQEIIGRDGDAAKLSFKLDWTEYHTYRIERYPYDGVQVFVDDETIPRIIFPESKIAELPDVQFGGTPSIAFGQFSTEGAESRWKFVHGLFSRGYEIAFKKNKSDKLLKTELAKTQAIVVVRIQDAD